MNSKIISAIKSELHQARFYYPSNKYLLYAMVEESGEVVKAFMDYKQKGKEKEEIQKELVQTIAMCVRLLEEGDPDFIDGSLL